MIYLSAFADEMFTDIQKQVEFLKRQDINFIELRFIGNKNIVGLDRKEQIEVNKLLSEFGIKCSAIGSPIGKVSVGSNWEEHFDLFKRTIDCAERLDTRLIRIFSFYAGQEESEEEFKDLVIDRLLKLTDYISGTDLILVHENETGIFGDTAEHCQLLAHKINSPNFSLAYDPGNFVWGQQITDSMQACWPLMKNDVIHIHIKDWKLGAKTGSIPGEGDAQITELMDELKAIKYDGFITLEPHLEQGGQFGGCTNELLYAEVVSVLRGIAKQKNIDLV